MVQAGRGTSLTLEPFAQPWVGSHLHEQHLEGDAPTERFLFGLVHHAHAAAADLAQDAVVAQALRHRGASAGPGRARGDGQVHRRGILEALDHEQRGKEVADLLGKVGVAAGVLLDVRVLAAAEALAEFLREHFDGIAIRDRLVHGVALNTADFV